MACCFCSTRRVEYEAGGEDSDSAAWFLREQGGPKEADCFYAHPTTVANVFGWNSGQQGYAQGKGAKLTGFAAGTPDLMETQAGAVRGSCNLWVPRYNQVGMLALRTSSPSARPKKIAKFKAAMALAYADLAAAFRCFLEERADKTRPFIILAHSQGSILMVKVIKECLAGTPHERSFVAAYLAGGYVPKDVVSLLGGNVHVSNGPLDSGCIMSWDTRVRGKFSPNASTEGALGLNAHHLYWSFFDGYCEEPVGAEDASKARVQVNPLTWAETEGSGDGGGYLGAHAHGVAAPELPPDAQAWGGAVGFSDGASTGHFLWVPGAGHMKDPGPAAGIGNLHPADVTCWFHNIEDNVPKRIEAWRAVASGDNGGGGGSGSGSGSGTGGDSAVGAVSGATEADMARV